MYPTQNALLTTQQISNNGSYYFPCKTASGTDQKMPDLKLYLGNGTAIYRASLLGPDQSQIPGSKICPPLSPVSQQISLPTSPFPKTSRYQLSFYARSCKKPAMLTIRVPKTSLYRSDPRPRDRGRIRQRGRGFLPVSFRGVRLRGAGHLFRAVQLIVLSNHTYNN